MNLDMMNTLQQMIPTEQPTPDELYKSWKKNSPLLYDTLVTHVLDWPTLTTQFLPINQADSDGFFDTFKLVLGTQTDGVIPNYLMIAKVYSNPFNPSFDYPMNKEERTSPRMIIHSLQIPMLLF
jgi:histone-binding protein RBBP4